LLWAGLVLFGVGSLAGEDFLAVPRPSGLTSAVRWSLKIRARARYFSISFGISHLILSDTTRYVRAYDSNIRPQARPRNSLLSLSQKVNLDLEKARTQAVDELPAGTPAVDELAAGTPASLPTATGGQGCGPMAGVARYHGSGSSVLFFSLCHCSTPPWRRAAEEDELWPPPCRYAGYFWDSILHLEISVGFSRIWFYKSGQWFCWRLFFLPSRVSLFFVFSKIWNEFDSSIPLWICENLRSALEYLSNHLDLVLRFVNYLWIFVENVCNKCDKFMKCENEWYMGESNLEFSDIC
jgi:hypothetical protein